MNSVQFLSVAIASVLAGLGLLGSCASPTPAPVYYPMQPPIPAPSPPVAPTAPLSGAFTPDAELRLCSGITVRNAPFTDEQRRVVRYSPFVEAAPGLSLALKPTNNACVTSGYGPRDGSFHRGVDMQSIPPTPVHAAGPGRIVDTAFRGGYGNQVVIDHGQGVYTRYAHLADFAPGVAPGAEVAYGAVLGMMGGTADRPVSPHLHYEILVGAFSLTRPAFGLDAVDPFSLPPAGLPAAPPTDESERVAGIGARTEYASLAHSASREP